MIATHNRVVELRKTLLACRHQDIENLEILVVDDTSTDGTYEMVRSEFPEVDIRRNPENRGSIASRNDILRRARGEIIIALDDDSRFTEADACRRIAERMRAEPDLGILSFQAIGPEHPERMTDQGRLAGEWETASFAACGAAIRRSMLEKTGMFPELFYHAYEEPDLCIRAWDAGYRVVQWNDLVVYHEWSGINRNEQRVHHLHTRNEALSVAMRYPLLLVPFGLTWKLLGQARYAVRRGWLRQEPAIWLDFLRKLPAALAARKAVRLKTVLRCAKLNRRPPGSSQATHTKTGCIAARESGRSFQEAAS